LVARQRASANDPTTTTCDGGNIINLGGDGNIILGEDGGHPKGRPHIRRHLQDGQSNENNAGAGDDREEYIDPVRLVYCPDETTSGIEGGADQ